MVNYDLILKGYWLCVDSVPHRYPLHEVTLIAISLSVEARIKKKGAALPRCCTGTCCKDTGGGLDVRILDSASGFGRKGWTWFFCSVPSSPGVLFTPLPPILLQLCRFFIWCVLGPRAERSHLQSSASPDFTCCLLRKPLPASLQFLCLLDKKMNSLATLLQIKFLSPKVNYHRFSW